MPFMFAIEKGIVAGLMAWVVLGAMDMVFHLQCCKKVHHNGLNNGATNDNILAYPCPTHIIPSVIEINHSVSRRRRTPVSQ